MRFDLAFLFIMRKRNNFVMRIEEPRKEDLQQLNMIYNAAFESNPCPEKT